MLLLGVDFTSAPKPRKPIMVAHGRTDGVAVRLTRLEPLYSFAQFEAFLQTPGPWLGVFDLPFGLPRELTTHFGWPSTWPELMKWYGTSTKDELKALFKAFMAPRAVGKRYAHRAHDLQSQAHSSMKWTNPPVAWMMHAGVPRLIAAGVHLPGLLDGDRSRVAIEGYPGLIARELIGARSYKSDTLAKRTQDRLIARKDLVDALEQGRGRLGVRLRATHAQRDELVDDGSGDKVDAVICLLKAGWAVNQQAWGVPANADPLEGWIASA